MSPFEYAMVLISIIIGLGITHILSSLASAVRPLRGDAPRVHLEITYLSWVGFIFVHLVTFWWFEFKWSELAPGLCGRAHRARPGARRRLGLDRAAAGDPPLPQRGTGAAAGEGLAARPVTRQYSSEAISGQETKLSWEKRRRGRSVVGSTG